MDETRNSAGARHLLRHDHPGRRPDRSADRASEGDGRIRQDADHLHLRPWRDAGRPLAVGKAGLFRRGLSHPAHRPRSPRREADGGRGKIVGEFTEAIDIMPTILDWLGLELPASMRRLHPLAVPSGPAPAEAGARRSIGNTTSARSSRRMRRPRWNSHSDQCTLNVIRDDTLQVCAFHGPAAAVLRSGEGSRPVPQCRAATRPMPAVCWNTRRRCCPGVWSMTSGR